MGASIFSETSLLERHRAMLRERGAGPHRANEQVANYIRLEQKNGRVSESADPRASADLVLGACYQRAYWTQFLGEELSVPDDQFVEAIVTTLMRALKP